MIEQQKIWDALWKNRTGLKLSGDCLCLPVFSNHLEKPSGSICDVGCGDLSYLDAISNALTYELDEYEDVRSSFRYFVGVDFSREALRLAKMTAEDYGIRHKTDFVQADSRYLPFRENSFESVACIDSLQLLGKEYKEGLNEINRIAREEIYLSVTKYRPGYDCIGPVRGGYLIKFPSNPYPVLTSTKNEFKTMLETYGLVKGAEIHPCGYALSRCFPDRLLFKIKKCGS